MEQQNAASASQSSLLVPVESACARSADQSCVIKRMPLALLADACDSLG
jgi:hypothetical protein